jgi:hypothetical protein
VSTRIELEGFGSVVLNPIKFRMPEAHWTDKGGKEVQYTIKGKGKGMYLNSEGKELKRAELKRVYVIGGKEYPTDRLKKTDIVRASKISLIDGANAPLALIGSMEDEKFGVVTDNTKIKETINGGQAILAKEVVFTTGGMPYNVVFSKVATPSGKEKFIAYAIRGDFFAALERYEDEPIEMPFEEQNASELSEALGV